MFVGVCWCLMIVFLVASSLEFRDERFLDTCFKETLINKWDTHGTDINEEVHSLGSEVQEENRWWEIEIVVGEYQ
jgi:hypothetical protein